MHPDKLFAQHKLYRNPGSGKVFGVCAGIAEYFGTDPFMIRAGTVVGMILFSVPVIIGYFLLALILPARPPNLCRSPGDEEFRRAESSRPDVTLADVTTKFRSAEKRLRALESYVSTREFELSSTIRDLDR
ncbi:MAG: PspC domain-containing protein [Rhodospirillaceae bacterium]